MNFDFNEDQFALRDSVRSFLTDRWGPRKARAAGDRFDVDLWQGLCGLGLQTLLIPTEHDGSGLTLIDFVLVLEEFGRALVPAAMVDTVLASEVIARHGTPAQRQALLPRIAGGHCRFAIAHAQAGAGPDASEVTLAAEEDAGGWRLRGQKILVPCAVGATHLMVSAQPPHGPAALFLCEVAAGGISIQPHRAVDPLSLLCAVNFDGARADPVGARPDAVALARLLDTSAFAAAAQMVGVSGAAMDLAVDYAKQRMQFERPIGSFQAVKHKCADMFVALEGATSAAYYASWALAGDEPEAALAVSMAKAACGDACRQICNDSMQVFGGVGFTWEFDIHLYMKRGRLLEAVFGDATLHRERVAAIVLDPAGAAAVTAVTAVTAA